MKIIKIMSSIAFMFFFVGLTIAQFEGELVSEFSGSELCGTYQVNFDQHVFLTEDFMPLEVEGSLSSRIYKKPESISNLEIYRSYEQELFAAGFDILLSCSFKTCDHLKKTVKAHYYGNKTSYGTRNYQKAGSYFPDHEYPAGFNEFYISARKALPDKTYYVLFLIGAHKPLYSIDIVEAAPMASGNVSLSPELLRQKLDDEGKIAIYDIYFDTDSDVIQPGSETALETISAYLTDYSALSFYIVGHTDNAGEPNYNMSLSERRAQAVAQVLVTQYGIAEDRLLAVGVGPFAPVQSNNDESGKAMNRRVELVIR